MFNDEYREDEYSLTEIADILSAGDFDERCEIMTKIKDRERGQRCRIGVTQGCTHSIPPLGWLWFWRGYSAALRMGNSHRENMREEIESLIGQIGGEE